jgi:hypothetical protein
MATAANYQYCILGMLQYARRKGAEVRMLDPDSEHIVSLVTVMEGTEVQGLNYNNILIFEEMLEVGVEP